jgi:predicted DsbA family dithiol-disulfide isomerase
MILEIEVLADVICPWCYIAKRRLEKAIARLDRQHEVRVHWLPFELNRSMPQEGVSRRVYGAAKFGSWEHAVEIDARAIAAGAAVGIHFAFDRIEQTPSTLDAHRMIWLADQDGKQAPVVEALFRAYFTEGNDIGESETLLDVVAEAGLDRRQAEVVLSSDEGVQAIEETHEQSWRLGIYGVPSFIVNWEITLTGIQELETFLTNFNQSLAGK